MNWPQTLKLPSKASHPARYRNASPRIPKYQFTLPPSFPPRLKTFYNPLEPPNSIPKPLDPSPISHDSPRPTHGWKHTEVPETLCQWYTYPIYGGMPRLNTCPSIVHILKVIESGSNTRGLTFVRGLMLAPSLLGVDLCLHASRGWMVSPYLHLQVPFPAELDREQP